MRAFLFCFFICLSSLFGEYSIVFIHIGKKIPPYAEVAIKQARLFNPDANIILLSSRHALKSFNFLKQDHSVQLCAYEDLPRSQLHKKYEKRCVETSIFWRYTSERFLYLWDLMEAYALDSVFHLENDVMLYANLNEYISFFERDFPRIAATFDNDDRCIPGFLWIANCQAMKSLAEYFVEKAPEKLSDMYVIGKYRKENPSHWIQSLPVIMPEYALAYPLESSWSHTTNHPERYSNKVDVFQAIFDAAAIGQYLGGNDPIHANSCVGFVNESCLFDPSKLKYEWKLDEENRLVPYAIFQDREYRIINLHIHSKRLGEFQSLSSTSS